MPAGVELAQAGAAAAARSGEVRRAGAPLDGRARARHDRSEEAGAHVFDYGNNLRGQAVLAGADAVDGFKDIPGFVPAYIRPLFCEGKGPFRWAALSGDPADIARHRRSDPRAVPRERAPAALADDGRRARAFQGLPARICWLGYGERHKAGLAFNELVRTGKVKAPIVIGRDHLDSGSVASPNRETEAMRDGSDAIGDWAFLNALVNCAAGATWVSVHHGGGVGMGYSLHAGMVVRRRRHRRRRRGGSSACLTDRSGDGRLAPRRRGLSARRSSSPASTGRGCRMFGSLVVDNIGELVTCARRRSRLGLVRDAAVVVRNGRVAFAGAARRAARRCSRRRRPRRRRPAGHAGPRRPAHAPRVRRLARARVRPAQPGQVVPRDPGGGRRHPLDGAGDARRQRRRARRRRGGAARSLPRAGRHRRRGQDRLRPDHRRRAAPARRHPGGARVARASTSRRRCSRTCRRPARRRDRALFVRAFADELIPTTNAEAVDVYCDAGAFTLDETRTILEAGQEVRQAPARARRAVHAHRRRRARRRAGRGQRRASRAALRRRAGQARRRRRRVQPAARRGADAEAAVARRAQD